MRKSEKNIEGWWKFDEITDRNVIPDLSGNDHALTIIGAPRVINDDKLKGAIVLDGETQWISTSKPILRTDQSFSIAAWVHLDSAIMSSKLELRKKEHSFALTAVSQDSPTHSAFYLGIRRIEETQPDGITTSALKWSFTVAPVDGSETGLLVWEHAHSVSSLEKSMLDNWVMLVGVYDVAKRAAYIYIPSINEAGIAYMPDAWTFWQADGALQIGRARWLGCNVDQWPGKIGPVRVFSGVLTEEDAKKLYTEDTLTT